MKSGIASVTFWCRCMCEVLCHRFHVRVQNGYVINLNHRIDTEVTVLLIIKVV